MITTLSGDNSFAWQQALNNLVQSFITEHGELALERLDGEEASFDRLREALVSLPFLAPQKLVILRAPSANKQFAAGIEQLLPELPETNTVVIVEPKLDKRQAYYKFLKKETDFKDFPELDANGFAKWLI